EDGARPFELGHQVEQLALIGRDVDGRETGGGVRAERLFERGVVGDEVVCDVAIDGLPALLGHERIYLMWGPFSNGPDRLQEGSSADTPRAVADSGGRLDDVDFSRFVRDHEIAMHVEA